ncbi:pilus assembly protein TadG-related protein [Acetobacter oeni]|uniref:VWFA domain-containing protein n=1 Tax=Acetobacter oeni TaxID=304077 RepID=A0A511XIP9_9PROT|nr:pilus assembly protein TadG-related protein [Acetobacter oeni]MBB3881936.1 Flp pilus assembly protein TadG [Acetobacter oeni]NHO17743.1 hypothetical protein [Acetobacter oeni]GBR06682.1 hypothetical protein AA21952_2094 [Acetobacter oeni LMG 21952]GEN62828.1 hypothetical protein AOE01nite_10520 [Acetobacter oeni]
MFQRLRASTKGSVTVLAPVIFLTAMIGISTATNMSVVLNTRTQLQNIADAASLKAAQAANNSLVSAGTSASDTTAQQVAETTAQQSVTANATLSNISPIPTTTVTYTPVTQYSGSVTVTLASTPAFFLPNLVPALSGPVTVTSTSSMSAANSYLQVIFVVDVSNSMTVGGTSTAITTLKNTASQCAFACHDTNGYYYAASNKTCTTSLSLQTSSSKTPVCDMRAYATANGIDLKIDYVKQAMQSFTSEISTFAASNSNHLTIGMTTFGTSVIRTLAPTTDTTAVTAAADALDVENATPYFNAQDNPSGANDRADYNGGRTMTSDALTQVAGQLTNVGDGSSPTKMKTYVIFLSDGAQDVYINSAALVYRNVNVDYTAACTTLKNMGVQLFSIWVPYYTDTSNSIFNLYIAPIDGTGTGSMEGSMQSCATKSDDYFQADDGTAIQAAFTATLDAIINDSSLRISQ